MYSTWNVPSKLPKKPTLDGIMGRYVLEKHHQMTHLPNEKDLMRSLVAGDSRSKRVDSAGVTVLGLELDLGELSHHLDCGPVQMNKKRVSLSRIYLQFAYSYGCTQSMRTRASTKLVNMHSRTEGSQKRCKGRIQTVSLRGHCFHRLTSRES
jgi:hypothetical protein